MTYQELYQQIYKVLNHTTPLVVDCGKLCGARCCQSEGEEESGMYLFPGEQVMFRRENWCRMEDSAFTSSGRPVPILFCDPPCPRQLRPLACRIFPFVPYVRQGKLTVIKDPRSRGMCPLFWAEETQFSGQFRKKTEYVCRFLFRIPVFHQYFTDLSEILDCYMP